MGKFINIAEGWLPDRREVGGIYPGGKDSYSRKLDQKKLDSLIGEIRERSEYYSYEFIELVFRAGMLCEGMMWASRQGGNGSSGLDEANATRQSRAEEKKKRVQDEVVKRNEKTGKSLSRIAQEMDDEDKGWPSKRTIINYCSSLELKTPKKK